jgi:hypothetical protein
LERRLLEQGPSVHLHDGTKGRRRDEIEVIAAGIGSSGISRVCVS